MKKIQIKYNRYIIEYDEDYGIDKRRGWSVALDGHYVVMFEKWFIMAIWKAVKVSRKIAEEGE